MTDEVVEHSFQSGVQRQYAVAHRRLDPIRWDLELTDSDSFGRWREFDEVAIRVAAARMQATCVNCHNTHQDSTYKSWKEGDVPGVLEIIAQLLTGVGRQRWAGPHRPGGHGGAATGGDAHDAGHGQHGCARVPDQHRLSR